VKRERLDPGHTALLFFDMLNGYIKEEGAVVRERYRPVIDAATRLLDAARASSMMVVYASANHRTDNATSVATIRDTDNRLRPIATGDSQASKPMITGRTWGAQIVDELKPIESDYLIPKYRWSAFYQTSLELALRTRGVDTIVIAGGSTDVGVASTAYAARDMDFNLVVVSDACTSPEEDNHRQFMQRVFPRMARVRTSAEVVTMLQSG
jgi:ureidoacrylate peracid hydrolase